MLKKKVTKNINYFIYLIIELCCAHCCLFKKSHSNHKILDISDLESFKKENIDIKVSTKENEEIIEDLVKLKDEIEKEINNINQLYDKTINDLTKSFKEKHAKLLEEENNLKEKLQNEVTKIKEHLEIYLSKTNFQIKLNERISKGAKQFEKEEKNILVILSYVSVINKSKKQIKELLEESIKSIKFSYKEKENNIIFDEFYLNYNDNLILKRIESGNCELDYGGETYGRLLFDVNTDIIYYVISCLTDKIDVYKNYENFKIKNLDKRITLPYKMSGTYSVLHKGAFYFFEFKNSNTNNLIKFDLNKNKVLNNKIILSDAVLGNSQNCWYGNNDIILISDNKNLYAVYSSKNNNKRISIAKIDENNLDVIKIWNTDSLEKCNCGPIFMINNVLYHIKTYNRENDSVIYSYDLLKGKSSKINIPFENKGGYDTSLTYYPHIKCLMTVNNSKIYKYKVILGKKEE